MVHAYIAVPRMVAWTPTSCGTATYSGCVHIDTGMIVSIKGLPLPGGGKPQLDAQGKSSAGGRYHFDVKGSLSLENLQVSNGYGYSTGVVSLRGVRG